MPVESFHSAERVVLLKNSSTTMTFTFKWDPVIPGSQVCAFSSCDIHLSLHLHICDCYLRHRVRVRIFRQRRPQQVRSYCPLLDLPFRCLLKVESSRQENPLQ